MKLDKDSKLMRKGEQNDIKWAQINWENKKEDKKTNKKTKTKHAATLRYLHSNYS